MTSRRFNEALENIRMSPIVAISEGAKGRAAEFEKSGRSFLTFQRGEIDFVEVPINEDFSVDCDKVERTVKGRDFFYLNNPQNPTGKVFGEDELIRIVEICTRHGCFIVSDESYEKIVYDGREHYSLAKIRQDNMITVPQRAVRRPGGYSRGEDRPTGRRLSHVPAFLVSAACQAHR